VYGIRRFGLRPVRELTLDLLVERTASVPTPSVAHA